MRVIDSAYQVSKKTGHDLEVIWEMSYDLNCSFFQLFEKPGVFPVKEFYIPRYVNSLKRRIIKFFRLAGGKFPAGYNRYVFNSHIEWHKENNSIPELFPKGEKIYISTVHQFEEGPDSYNYFKPIKKIEEILNEIKTQFTGHTIGIHIRRTDNKMSIQNSPREAFVDKMQEAVNDHADAKFFLATDSADEEQYLKQTFPDKIITYEKELSRNSEKGIQDALVDLYCLSSTNKIFGSFYSSFSEVAAQIGNIPLEIINIAG